MHGLLIVPKWFFFTVGGKLKSDFIGWQLVCLDGPNRRFFCGEIAGGVAFENEAIFTADLAWQAERRGTEPWQKVAPGPITVPLDDHHGASYESGACNFDPGILGGITFQLHPPGSVESMEEGEYWSEAKRVATA